MALTGSDVSQFVIVFEQLHLEQIARHVSAQCGQKHPLGVVGQTEPAGRLVLAQALGPLDELLASG